MKISLLYLGCRVNQAEISEMEKALRAGGHEIVGLEDAPDTCIINTCTVTKKSDDQSRQLIRKASVTGANIVVTGCYAELNSSDIKDIPGNIAIVDNSNKPYIINKFIDNSSSLTEGITPKPLSRSKYFLKVQDGCDNRCTYCRVWMARGKSRSVNIDDAVIMSQEAEASGYMEIDLTGIHLGMYGRDFPESKPGVGGLLETLLNKTEKCRFRLSSLEVSEVDERIIEILGDQRVCSHLHIPLQSGDNKVLLDMGRDYTSEQYAHKINMIHGKLGNIGLGADVIAGFPSESPEAFERTASLIKALPFTYLHVFPYSDRPGTIASSMNDSVGTDERKRRAALLREIGSSKKDAYMRSNIGRTLEVLLERPGKNSNWLGTSDNYLKVEVLYPTVTDAEEHALKGRLVNVDVQASGESSVSGNAIDKL